MINFLHPEAFLLLLFVPCFYVARSLKIFSRMKFAVTLYDWNDTSEWRINNRVQKFLNVVSEIFLTFAFICVTIAATNPLITHSEKIYTSRGSDIIFVLDVSPSMAARDMGGQTRLAAAKNAIQKIVSENHSASFGIVALASEAAISVPVTSHRENFLAGLDSLSVGMLGDGSALGSGISCATYHLLSSSAPSKCIVLLTDGENNSGIVLPETAATLAASHGITVHVLAIGSKGSVQLDFTDRETGKTYSGFLESNFDVSSLRNISDNAFGQTFEIQTLQALENALLTIDEKNSVSQTFYTKIVKEHKYFLFVSMAFLFVVAAWIVRRVFLKSVT